MYEKVKVGDVLYVRKGSHGGAHRVVTVGKKWMMTDLHEQFSITPSPDGSFPGKPPRNYYVSACTAWRSPEAYEDALRARQQRAKLAAALEQAIRSDGVTTAQLMSVAAVLGQWLGTEAEEARHAAHRHAGQVIAAEHRAVAELQAKLAEAERTVKQLTEERDALREAAAGMLRTAPIPTDHRLLLLMASATPETHPMLFGDIDCYESARAALAAAVEAAE